MTILDRLEKAKALRLDVLEMVHSRKAGHIGGSMSCMDILVALFYEVMDVQKLLQHSADRDRFILSKGHCAEAYYAVLADCGFFPREELKSFTAFGSRLAEHPTKTIPGVEVATGALGHGLPIGVGMAIGLKKEYPDSSVYVLMGDGEQAEGSIWEAAMAAAKYKLDNLVCIIDRNRLQISGYTEDVMPLDDLANKYSAFGFHVVTCGGHDPQQIDKALRTRCAGKPTMVIANTIKGYGSAVMEEKVEWHHTIPNDEQYALIRQHLALGRKEA